MSTLVLEHSVSTCVEASQRVLQVAAMFGLGVDDARKIQVVPRCEIPLPHLQGKRGIVFITGPSGSGKSTLLRLIAERCADDLLLQFDQFPAPADRPLVDALAGPEIPLQRIMGVLSIVGLSDAFVMLRTPSQLSDGQRYRLRLAQMILASETAGERRPVIALADEFGATLDRLTAITVARNLRRWIDSVAAAHQPLSFICATTHDDLVEPLAPDVLVWKGLGEEIEIITQERDRTQRET